MEKKFENSIKQKLINARQRGLEQILLVEKEIEPIHNADEDLVTEFFLSYRGIRAWNHMISLAERMSPILSEKQLIKNQLAFAFHRIGRSEEAIRILLDQIERRPDGETYSILGRIYKVEWHVALQEGDTYRAKGLINKAIDAYLKGFETDWRNAYPGINAVTLMELKEPPDKRRKKLIPVVTYAVERHMATSQSDYWDWSTLLELAILAENEHDAEVALVEALAKVREAWEPKTTLQNLKMIRLARERRGKNLTWALSMEEALEKSAIP